MNGELIAALNMLEEEKGISKELMFDTIERALFEEYKEQFSSVENCHVEIDRVTGDFHIYSDCDVIEDDNLAADGMTIGISKAREINPDVKLGDTISVEYFSDDFTRKAAQKAKGAIVQAIREAEKSALYNEFHSREKDIVTGIVQRVDDRGNILIEVGNTQTVLRANDQIPGEVYRPGDRIRVVIVSVENKGKGGIQIRVSRSSSLLVKRLFEEEVTEIADGVVEINGIAREAGSRTKMSVYSNNENVDPIGACVGPNGARVRAIVDQLHGEQIDIINWDENPAQFIVNALSPAKVVSISADTDENKALVVVSDQQLSLAIGKAGQNVRLAAKLCGYGIDIKSESQYAEMSGDEEMTAVEYDDDAEAAEDEFEAEEFEEVEAEDAPVSEE